VKKIIPIFYSEYGRYINRFRAIPSFIDGLKPVERRVLLSLHKEGRKKAVKSATIIGYALGHLHPHGDQSLYDTLVNIVNQEYAKGEGNWGSPGLEDDYAAAYRYCITGDTKIPTAKGYINIKDLSKYSSEDIDENVFDCYGNKVHASKFFDSGKHPIIKIQTSYGYSLKGSYNHPILTLTKDLELKWKTLSELKIDDCAVLQGNIDYSNPQDILNEDYSKILDCANLFNHGIENLKDAYKKIPDIIWKANKVNQRMFLQYLFANNGSISFGQKTITIFYISISQQLLQDLQQLLLMCFNIVSSIYDYKTSQFGEKRLVISGTKNCTEFANRVGFFGQKQNKLLESLKLLKIRNFSGKTRSRADRVPGIRQYLLNKYGLSKFKANFLDSREAWNIHKSQVSQIIDKDDLEKINNLMDTNYRFDKISNIEKLEDEQVYSIRVDSDNHSFIGNGFVNHNTEVSLKKWVDDLAFTYLDETYVPYQEFELEPEPIYLPSPIPIGLIGHGVITGISFYRTLIPKYKLSDLAKRLAWILHGKKKNEEIIIQPNSKDCTVSEAESGDFQKILTTGIGSINYTPHGKLDHKDIRIQGRAPNSSFNILVNNQEKLDINLIDHSSSQIDILVEPKKKSTNLQTLATIIWQEYLIKKLNFNCIFCDNEGNVGTYGIDEILTYNYNLWKYSVQLKNIDDFNKLSNRKVELMIVQIIRYIFEQYKSNTVEEIITHFKELKKNSDISIEIDIFDVDNNIWKKKLNKFLNKILLISVIKEQLRI